MELLVILIVVLILVGGGFYVHQARYGQSGPIMPGQTYGGQPTTPPMVPGDPLPGQPPVITPPEPPPPGQPPRHGWY